MTEYLPAIRTAVDAGMVVLILLVQLIIYPSFHAIDRNVFSTWHRRYVMVIGFIVIPLMLVQAACIGTQLLTDASWDHILSAAAMLGAWIVTFTFSVPCHRKLEHQGKDPETITRLIRTNWLRTACWITVFAAGYWCLDTPLVEGLAGKQKPMEERLEHLVEQEFHARVLQPRSAQLRIEKITRKTIEAYLYAVQVELDRVQVEFGLREQDWQRYLAGLPATVLTLEANRQVPLLMKGLTAGSGAVALKIGRSLTGRVRELMLRRMQRELLEDGMRMGGRYAVRGAAWWIGGICIVWDLADHHRTIQQNRPVLQRSLKTYLDELEEQVLRDQRCGILSVLNGVQREVMKELNEGS